MKDKPVCLDLFCGAGGASAGYAAAGFRVIGMDINPQPHYPYRFLQRDAMEVLAELAAGNEVRIDGDTLVSTGDIAMIHASPPCQAYTRLRALAESSANTPRDYPDMLSAVQSVLDKIALPYIIENVQGAPLRNAGMLCGTMFGLRVFRHRYFESNILLFFPSHRRHPDGSTTHVQYGFSSFANGATHIGVYGKGFCAADARLAMAIGWMTGAELSQAIPPAYTAYLGRQMMRVVR